MIFTDEQLEAVAQQINNCFDNGCGCCSRDEHDLEGAVEILRTLLEEAKK